MSRLKKKYLEEIKESLMKKFSYENPMNIPELRKVVISMGVSEALNDKNAIQGSFKELMLISGQKPIVTRAKKSVANFKLREGQAIGCSVTLRGVRQWEFLDRLLSVALPRVRDFSGVSPKAFDGRGNYTFGVREQTIFPEVDYDNVDSVRGMDICITTSASNDEQGRALLDAFNFPFKK